MGIPIPVRNSVRKDGMVRKPTKDCGSCDYLFRYGGSCYCGFGDAYGRIDGGRGGNIVRCNILTKKRQPDEGLRSIYFLREFKGAVEGGNLELESFYSKHGIRKRARVYL